MENGLILSYFTLLILHGDGIATSSTNSSSPISYCCSQYVNWGYEHPNGPDKWPQQCHDHNHDQSPIDINSNEAKANAIPGAPPLIFKNYHQKAKSFTLQNTGHGVRLLAEWKGSTPTVSGAHLGKDVYAFQEIHFHWGETHFHGSEHRIDNEQYPLEAHFVHANEKYRTMRQALANRGVLVLGVLFEVHATENYQYRPALSLLHKINLSGNNSKIKDLPPLRDLLPVAIDRFFYYNGSLTTPDCTVGVKWIVFEDPSHVSLQQMEGFRHIYAPDMQVLNKTYRPIQSRRGQDDVWYRSMAQMSQPCFIHILLPFVLWCSNKLN